MNKILVEIKQLDKSIFQLLKSGIQYNFSLILISCLLLLTYDYIYANPIVYTVGISLFRSASFFIVGFVVCSFVFQKIMRDLKE